MAKRTVRDSAIEPTIATAVLDEVREAEIAPKPTPQTRRPRTTTTVPPARRFAATHTDDGGTNHQAELFYLQKQIQQQTQMIFVLEDGSRVQGIVEWYDRHSIKVRGKLRLLIYKAAIKYLYKAGETGTSMGE